MSFDIERVRRDTPGCNNRIHFNNAGAALPPRQVTDSMVEYLRLESEIGGYEASEQQHEQQERVYKSIAKLVGASRDEIALMENATRAWDMALYAIPFKPGDRILTSRAEYPGNYVGLMHLSKRTGAVVEVIPEDETGQISLDALRNAMDSRVKIIAITHVPTNNGLINPAEEVGEIAREANVLYMLDACQSAGQIPLDVKRFGCDMLAATGRKYLRGPRGIGFLYVKRDKIADMDPPLLDQTAADFVGLDSYEMHPDARRFETWEGNMAVRLGLGVAIDYALEWGIETIQARVVELAERLRSGLVDIKGMRVHDIGRAKCGIVTFTHERLSASDIRSSLTERGISIYTRPATPLDTQVGRSEPVARASVHYYNTEEEISRTLEALKVITQG